MYTSGRRITIRNYHINMCILSNEKDEQRRSNSNPMIAWLIEGHGRARVSTFTASSSEDPVCHSFGYSIRRVVEAVRPIFIA